MSSSCRIWKLAALLWLVFCTAAVAAMPDSIVIDDAQDPMAQRTWVYTATIGLDWDGFPVRQYHNFLPPGSPGAVPLDYTGQIYITGRRELDEFGVLQPWEPKIPPQALVQLPWTMGHDLRGLECQAFLGGNCCWYSGCPADDPSLPAFNPNCWFGCFQGCDFVGCNTNSRIVIRRMLEDGQFPVDQYGNIHIVDAHGGSIADNWLKLTGLYSIQDSPSEPAVYTWVVIYLGLGRPGPYSEGDMAPGDKFTYSIGHRYGSTSYIWVSATVLAVHHSTADVSWASRGVVDASDLGVVAGSLGKPPCYGYLWTTEPPPSCTYQQCAPWYADLDGSGCIDASDLSRLASVLGKRCAISKSDPQDAPAKVLAWFGLEYTGKTLVEWNGVPFPEVRIADEARMHRAVLDPYGYRNATAAAAVLIPWGSVKTLYR